MKLSPQDFDLIRKVAEGKESFNNESFLHILWLDDEDDDWLDDEDDDAKSAVFKWMLTEVPLSEEQKAELEREIIDVYASFDDRDGMWVFDNGYLRHRFVTESVSHECWLSFYDFEAEHWFKRIIQYIFTDYTPSEGEPSKEQLILSIVKSEGFETVPVHLMIDIIKFFFPSYCYEDPSNDRYEEPSKEQFFLSIVKSKWFKDDPAHLMIDINTGVFDQLDPTDKDEALKLLLDRCNSDEDGPLYEDIILAWVKRGLLSGMYWSSIQLQRLKEWVKARPDLDRYLEAGFWEALSVHERSLMIAPLLDRVESAIQAYPGIILFLRLEKPSPLLTEVKEELDRLTKSFSTLFYETHKKTI